MEFVRVASTKDLVPGKILPAQLGDKQVMIVNLEGRYYAIGNMCTHQACLLSSGKLTGEFIECPCHGSLFSVKTGTVQNGPAKDPVPVFQVKAEQDQILIGMPEKPPVREKIVQKSFVLAALESPQGGVSDFAEEYGKPLGLRGIGAGLSFENNFHALLRYKLKTRLITKHETPVLETSFFGKKVEMPLLASSMSGLSYTSSMTEDEFAYCILEGARLAGTIGFTGHTSKEYKIHPGIDALRRVQGHGVNIFKPQSQEIILDLIKQSENEKAVAVGIDIDGAGSVNFARAGKPVYRKTIREIRELKRSTHLPFMVKGVMCVEDALAAAEAGVDAIGVSNHGGRVLDATPGVADVLPSIVKALRRTKRGKRIVVTADGAVRTGYDAMKLLALGADFALIGRPLARQALDSGVEGVKAVLEYIKTDIRKAMIMTSCNSVKDINERILYRGY
jgi:4-hydroxymandelate oxidase